MKHWEITGVVHNIMKTKRMQRVYIFLLLAYNIPSNSGQYDYGGAAAATDPAPVVGFASSSIHRILLLRGSNIISNYDSVRTVSHASTRRIEKDVINDDDNDDIDDKEFNDIDGEFDEEYTLDHEPQREFKQRKNVVRSNQTQLGGNNAQLEKSLGSGILRDNHNITDEEEEEDNDQNDDDEEEEKDIEDNETGGNSGSDSPVAGNDDLQENTEIAILRHEDPLPERDVLGDSIFLLQPVSDNVFESRQHDGG